MYDKKRLLPKSFFLKAFCLIILAFFPVQINAYGNSDIKKEADLEQPFFLFSDETISNPTQDTYVFFSDVKIEGDCGGDIFLFFSTARLGENVKIKGKFRTFSSKIFCPSKIAIEMEAFFSELEFIVKEKNLGFYKEHSDIIPNYIFKLIFSVFSGIICLLIYQIKKSFFEQSAVAIHNEPANIIKNGLIVYFVALFLATLFLISVIGFFMTIIIIIFIIVITLMGEISMSLLLGYFISTKFEMKKNGNVYFFIGFVGSEAIKFIPYISWLYSVLVVPIVCMGIITTGFINGFYKNIFYETDFLKE